MNQAIVNEVKVLMDKLYAAWGSVDMEHTEDTYIVSDPTGTYNYEAPTLLEALRKAVEEDEMV